MAFSIDDLIALLMQAEPGDRAILGELRAMLAGAIVEPSLPDDVRVLFVSAAQAASRGALADVKRLVTAAADKLQAAAEPPDAPAPANPDFDAALVADFVTEGCEYLEGAEAALLHLETNPGDTEAINTVFRAFHTIKGTAGFLGLDAVASLAHRAESLLSRIRDREITCAGRYAELALCSIDALKALLGEVAAPPPAGATANRYAELTHALEHLDDVRAPEDTGSQDLAGSTPTPTPVREPTADHRAERTESSVRVRTERLDQLIDMIGELVIAHAMIAEDELLATTAVHTLARKVTHAGKIVRELQDLSMGMRMVPLKGPFQKVLRLARDLAHRSAKQVDVVLDGEDTEIDRNLVDVLSDPLVHMVRNALDHGLEPPDARVAAGKPAAGRLSLSAYHAGGNVVVEIRDDGRGLDRERILAKAVEAGIVAPGAAISDREIYELIFAPGFSTAEVVTDISGRGVGMDVVRRNVEAMRGRIEIESHPGAGTRFIIRLPLTLAITDGMLVRVGGERYIVPTVHIQLSFRPDENALSTIAGRGEIVMLRGDVLPLVRLHRLFGVPDAEQDPTRGLLMVVGDAGRRVALLVDELLGQHQVVAKSVGDGVGRAPGVSGGAILGDGRVGLILDVHEILSIARGHESRAPRVA